MIERELLKRLQASRLVFSVEVAGGQKHVMLQLWGLSRYQHYELLEMLARSCAIRDARKHDKFPKPINMTVKVTKVPRLLEVFDAFEVIMAASKWEVAGAQQT